MSSLKLVISSISTNSQTRGQQRWAQQVLDMKRVPYQLIDLSQDENAIYRRLINQGGAKIPLLIIGNQAVLTFDDFEALVEDKLLEKLLSEDGHHVPLQTTLIAS